MNGNPTGSCINLNNLIPKYLSEIPVAPSATSGTEGTDYYVALSNNGHLQFASKNSKEHSLVGVTIGTSTDAIDDLNTVVDACGVSGDATDPDCWSENNIGNQSVNWNTANLLCDSLIEGGLEEGSWRLPLDSHFITAYNSNIDGFSTEGFTQKNYWSSRGGPSLAYYVEMDTGNSYLGNVTNTFNTRCIRK